MTIIDTDLDAAIQSLLAHHSHSVEWSGGYYPTAYVINGVVIIRDRSNDQGEQKYSGIYIYYTSDVLRTWKELVSASEDEWDWGELTEARCKEHSYNLFPS